MSEKRYERIDAEGLLEPLKSPSASVYGMLLDCGHGLDIRDVGIWPGAAHEWHPSVDIPASARSTRLIHTPALPFPFDGADLAAFMLDGLGAWVRDYYGTDGAVDEEQLRTIALSYDYSRDAVREAFDLLNEAIKVIGPEPDSNTPEWIEWRRAMVRKLYEMRQDSPSASAPALAGPCEAVPVLGAGRRRAPTVHELIAPFIARVLADHPEWTAKQIHSEMCRAARERTYGLQMSRAGELVCSAAGRAFGLPAIEKAKTAHRKNRGSTVEPPSNR